MKISKPNQLRPQLAELEAKQLELAAKKAALLAKIADARKRIQESPSSESATEIAANNRVLAILGRHPPATEGIPTQLDELLIALNDLNKAIEVVCAETRREMEIASRLVWKEVLPEAMKRAKAFAKAYLDLYASHRHYDALLDEVESTGATISSADRIFPTYLGSPKDTCGGYHYSIQDFVDAGVIERSDMPEAIR